MIWHMQIKEVGDVDAPPNIGYGKSYHIMSLKDTDYLICMLTTYGALGKFEGSEMHQKYKGSGGEVATKLINYHEVFGNHFHYPHQVGNNNNNQNYPISVERTWATNYWPDLFHAYFLVLTEVNKNYFWGYLVEGANVNPELYFQHQLV